MIIDKQTILDQIRADIVNSNICPDLAQEAKNLVMGHGNLNSDVMFVGEAPGKHEDEQAKPFVGASGKLLDSLLESIGLARSNVYITNIVKYRPPKNRDPLAIEKSQFSPYLSREIALVEPKIIATLGRHSMEFFLPDKKISEMHGHVFKLKFEGRDIELIPLYHPAAALYNGSLRKILESDFINIKKLIK